MLPPSAGRPRILVAFAYWSEPLFAGIATRAAEYGWELDQRMRWSRQLPPEDAAYDGIIVYANGDRALIDRVLSFHAPIVDMENYADDFHAPKVIGDDRAIGKMAAEHLLRCDAATLVFIRPETTPSTTGGQVIGERRDGFFAAAAAAERPCFELSESAVTTCGHPGPLGIFCGSDITATRLEQRLLDSGRRIPEDAAILGAHDTPHCCELAPVPLSSINVDFERKGRVAAELLHRLLAGDPAPHAPLVVGPRGVTVRASTRLAPAGESDFARLMTVLQSRFAEPIAMEDLCRAAGLSLPDARAILRERLDRTLIEELTRIRVEHAKTLLRENRLTTEGIATACGFGTRQTLFNAFKRILGESPEAWRSRQLPPD